MQNHKACEGEAQLGLTGSYRDRLRRPQSQSLVQRTLTQIIRKKNSSDFEQGVLVAGRKKTSSHGERLVEAKEPDLAVDVRGKKKSAAMMMSQSGRLPRPLKLVDGSREVFLGRS